MKAMTLRLPPDLASDLEIVADVERQSVAEVVRVAVTHYLAARRPERQQPVSDTTR